MLPSAETSLLRRVVKQLPPNIELVRIQFQFVLRVPAMEDVYQKHIVLRKCKQHVLFYK